MTPETSMSVLTGTKMYIHARKTKKKTQVEKKREKKTQVETEVLKKN